MASKQHGVGSPTIRRRRIMIGLSIILGLAVAMPEELPAAPIVGSIRVPIMEQPNVWAYERLKIHCCHQHPVPPYSNYCCHVGGVGYAVPGYVAPAYGYGYGAASVRGQSRRVARRTTRRVSRRR